MAHRKKATGKDKTTTASLPRGLNKNTRKLLLELERTNRKLKKELERQR